MSIEFAIDVGDFCSYIVVRFVGVAGVFPACLAYILMGSRGKIEGKLTFRLINFQSTFS